MLSLTGAFQLLESGSAHGGQLRKREFMFTNADEVLRFLGDHKVEFVDVRFCGLPGTMQHFTVSAGQVAAFAAAAFILIVIPGPSVLFVVGRALADGRRTALASVAGNAAGLEVVAVCVALGIGTLVERSALVFIVVKLAGAGYLIWLGIRAVRQRRGLASALSAASSPRRQRRAVLEGVVVGVANPKAVILFAAILPQFVNRRAGHVPVQMLLLSLVSFAIALVSDSAWGLLASTVRAWFARSPRRLQLVGAGGGLAMIGLGLLVAVTGRTT